MPSQILGVVLRSWVFGAVLPTDFVGTFCGCLGGPRGKVGESGGGRENVVGVLSGRGLKGGGAGRRKGVRYTEIV